MRELSRVKGAVKGGGWRESNRAAFLYVDIKIKMRPRNLLKLPLRGRGGGFQTYRASWLPSGAGGGLSKRATSFFFPNRAQPFFPLRGLGGALESRRMDAAQPLRVVGGARARTAGWGWELGRGGSGCGVGAGVRGGAGSWGGAGAGVWREGGRQEGWGRRWVGQGRTGFQGVFYVGATGGRGGVS